MQPRYVASGRKWLRALRSAAANRRAVVCFPHASGSAGYYRSWVPLMPPNVDLIAVQYPGRADRLDEPLATTVEEAADSTALELATSEYKYIVLFGHSFGAAIAFETAARLETRSVDVTALFLSAFPGPGRPHARPRRHFSDEDLWQSIMALNGTDPVLASDPQLRALVMPSLRSDINAAESYKHSASPLSIPICALSGDSDIDVSPRDMQAWRAATTGDFCQRIFPGGHFYVNAWAELIASELIGRFDAPV